MARRIIRFSVVQAAKMFGVLYAIMGLLFMPFFFVMAKFAPAGQGVPFGIGFALFLPVLYGCLGFVFTAVAAALYNLVAGWIGGIEVEVTAQEGDSSGPSYGAA
jgi:hypothetical protein